MIVAALGRAVERAALRAAISHHLGSRPCCQKRAEAVRSAIPPRGALHRNRPVLVPAMNRRNVIWTFGVGVLAAAI
jgi:hypothetical protein